jgi:hypothetical protein
MRKFIIYFVCVCLIVFSLPTTILATELLNDDFGNITSNQDTELIIQETNKTEDYITTESQYLVEGQILKDISIRDAFSNELLYLEISQGDDVAIYEKGKNYVLSNGKRVYFSVEKETIYDSPFSSFSITQNDDFSEPTTSITTSINWMPIRTTWYTFRVDQYIKDATTTLLWAIVRATIWFSIPSSVVSTVKLYHQSIYALRYNKDWKCKEVYCGAQGYYNKYAIKSYHYALLSGGSLDYIENSYAFTELY